MRYIALAFSLCASTAFAQQPNGIINAPIYATGYISQTGGTDVTTKILPQPNHPTDLNIYLTSAVTGTWTIQLPNPAFEGQVLSFSCGASASTITVVSSDGSSLDSSIPITCYRNSGFVIQFDQRSNIWRNVSSIPPIFSTANIWSAPQTLAGAILTGFPGVTSNLNGLNIGADLHPSWGVVQPTANYSGSQWQVYGTAAQGRATPSAGTGNITLDSGSNFDSAWVGLPFFYFQPDGQQFGTRYKVSAVTDNSHLTIQTVAGGAVSLAATQGTFHFVADISQTVVNCSGYVCTRVSGDLFSSLASITQPSYIVIAGTIYQANSSTSTSVTLTSSPGTLTGVAATQYTYDYDNISLFRVQKYLGSSEEALLIGARAIGDYEIRPTYAGNGKYRPLIIGNGEPSTGVLGDQIVVQPDGNLTLGGPYGTDTLRIQGNDLSAATNFLYLPTVLSGGDVTLAAGKNTTDTNVGVNITTIGTGKLKANGANVLLATNNLSDVSSAATSLTNLGGASLTGTNTFSGSNTFNQPVSFATQSLIRGDYSDFRFAPTSGSNTNRWRFGTTINGASDGYWYLQHSTDNYVANFWIPIACNNTGCGFGGNTSPSYPIDVTGTARTGSNILTPVAIASLPTCNAAAQGMLAVVNNGTAYGTGTYGSAVSATGIVTRSVLCTNTAGATTYAWAYN